MYVRNRFKRFLGISFVSLFIYLLIEINRYRTIVKGWDSTTSRDISQYVYPNVSTILLRPEDLCEASVYLMIVVCSAPNHFDARSAVRETWGSEKNVSGNPVKIYFLLGQTFNNTVQTFVERESMQYRDIIQEDFIDTYNNLTLKSLMLLKLVKTECRSTVTWVMKTDDDMFVNLQHLVALLSTRKRMQKVLFGNLICGAKPVRDLYDKWYAPEYMYAGTTYPNYLSGTGYVMSADVPEILFETALRTPLLHLEDVYLTGICAKEAHLKPSHNKDFHYKNVQFNPCIYKTLITTHYLSPTEVRYIHYMVYQTNLQQACVLQKAARHNATIPVAAKHLRTTRVSRRSCW